MRKKEREITHLTEIEDIITKSDVCRLAFAKENIPYIVPVSFGYDGKHLFIHTATEGKKIEFIKANNNVCFEFDIDVKTITHDTIGCKWSTSYKSVIGTGKIYEITNEKEMIDGLNHIMKHYSGKEWKFTSKMLQKVRIWKIQIETITGKRSN